jgi:hypothetical protein
VAQSHLIPGQSCAELRLTSWAAPELKGVESSAWPTDVLERMVPGRTKVHELERLLPRTWKMVRKHPVIATWRADHKGCSRGSVSIRYNASSRRTLPKTFRHSSVYR